MHTKLRTLYSETDERIQKWIKIVHVALVKVAPVFCVLPPSIVSYVTYVTTDLGNQAFELPVPMWFPLDTKTPIGYLLGAATQYIFILNTMIILKSIAMIGFAALSMLFSLANDIKCDLDIINLCSKFKRERSKMVKKLPQFIQFHSDTIQLSCNMKQIPNF